MILLSFNYAEIITILTSLLDVELILLVYHEAVIGHFQLLLQERS